ncbi:hypothetical protein AK812_SmicGene8258 [Symbiodinium microadriaticum]|uniref:Uncharacterized protein n=1 Tax=Symbiodinium microadriaticum TaxID=2951 RepID=A0A1Q9ELG2_SYMMI|nr:hypothetical protein AK812_SmicGene8258 [Symbiodinium microadriaticum]
MGLGWSFRDLLFALGTAIPIGYVAFPENEVVLLPPMTYAPCLHCKGFQWFGELDLFGRGTQSAVARKRSKASKSMQSRGGPAPQLIVFHIHGVPVTRQHEAIVIVFGWNEDSDREDGDLGMELKVKHKQGLLGARYKLEQLPLDEAEKIFILADSSSSSDEAAVIMPQVLGKRAEHNCWKSGLIDYINSNRLSCQVLAQVLRSAPFSQSYSSATQRGIIYGTRSHSFGILTICIRHLADYVFDQGDEDDDEGKQINFNEVLAAVLFKKLCYLRSAEELEKKELDTGQPIQRV